MPSGSSDGTAAFRALFVAALAHVVEEYVLPGGFLGWMHAAIPGAAAAVTPPVAVGVNVAFLSLLAVAALAGPALPLLALTAAALAMVNGMAHVAGTAATGRYSPGLVTGVVLYQPLGIAAWRAVGRAGRSTGTRAVAAVALALLAQAAPIALSLAAAAR